MRGATRSVWVAILILVFYNGVSAGEETSASEILNAVDEVLNAPKDRKMNMRLVLIDKAGNEKVREIIMMQKGGNKRMGKIVSPADQKGIGFLSLPNDVTYIYMPAYKKTQLIASHVKHNKFAGTDFTYEDMEAKNYADDWQPELIGEEDGHYILELELKEDSQSEYSKLVMWVDKENFYPTRLEHYDKGGNLYKVMISEEAVEIDGYWVATESQMEDLKMKHKTTMILIDVEFDSDLSDDLFTERYLER